MSASVSGMPRRAAVDHAADRRPVALAEGRDAEHMAEGVEATCVFHRSAVVGGGSARGGPGVRWPSRYARRASLCVARGLLFLVRRRRRPRPARSAGARPSSRRSDAENEPISARAVPPCAVTTVSWSSVAYHSPTRRADFLIGLAAGRRTKQPLVAPRCVAPPSGRASALRDK